MDFHSWICKYLFSHGYAYKSYAKKQDKCTKGTTYVCRSRSPCGWTSIHTLHSHCWTFPLAANEASAWTGVPIPAAAPSSGSRRDNDVVSPASHTAKKPYKNVITLVVEGHNTTSVKLRLRYRWAKWKKRTRIHRAKETSETASQTRCKVVEDQLRVVRCDLSHVRDIFMGDKWHHLEHGRRTGWQMTNDEPTVQFKRKQLRVDLLVRLSNNNQVRELLLSGLFAHVNQGELL